ncbi:MAG TPA: DUF5915 domain-containing protein, partial [Pirellulales bacterium]
AEELNVKQVEFAERADQYITYTVLPDLKRLGPRLGKQLGELRAELAKADAGALLAQLEAEKVVNLNLPSGAVTLDALDLQVRLQAKPGWAAAQGAQSVVVLSTELDDELVSEGYARELVHAIQTRRKDLDCGYTDRISVGLVTEAKTLRDAADRFRDYIMRETLARQLTFEPIPGVEPATLKLGSMAATLYVQVLPA